MVRVVHVDQGAQPDAGLLLGLDRIVGLGGGQQWARLGQNSCCRARWP